MTEGALSRRSLLGGIAAGGLTALAGCSFGKNGNATPTSTPAMTTATTTTVDKAQQAVVAGQKALADAWTELWAHRPLTGGQLALETAVSEEFNKSEVTSSVTLAREKLETAREELPGDKRAWVSALLAFGDYIDHKASAYQQLFAAHSEFGVAVTAYGQNLLIEAIAAAHRAETAIAGSSIAFSRAEKSLQTITQLDQQDVVRLTETFEPFNLESEDTEISLLTNFIVEYSPAISAAQRHFQGMQYLNAGSDAHVDEQYQTAIETFENAHEQFVGAEDYSSTALDRNVRYRKKIVSFINCLAPELQQTATAYKNAASAAQNGNIDRASSLRTQGTENYRTALQECRASVQQS